MKSLLVFHSFAGYGHMAINVVLPILKAGKVDPTYLPTTLLSTHTAYPNPVFVDQEVFVRDSLVHFDDLKLTFDGLLSGYCFSIDLLMVIKEYFQNHPTQIKIVDPVLGDHGKLYAKMTLEHVEAFRSLIKEATIITPNFTEAMLLADVSFPLDQVLTDDDLALLINRLSDLSDATIIIKGVFQSEHVHANLVIENRKIIHKFEYPHRPYAYFGSGDLFVSLIALQVLHHIPIEEAIKVSGELVLAAMDDSLEIESNLQKGIEIHSILERVLQHIK